MKVEYGRILKKAVVACFKYYPGICLARPLKIMINLSQVPQPRFTSGTYRTSPSV
jgi:hypothetical protein